jgi:L-lysine 6-oxidase
MTQFKIHPAVGIARVGNSKDDFYLEPISIGGLPLECDAQGNERQQDGQPVFVREFKSQAKEIRRQGAKFRVYAYGSDGQAEELTLSHPDVASMTWQVHIANKKAGFWNFGELLGNTLISPDNTYENAARQGLITLRNPSKVTKAERQQLIIDPGPRTLTGANQKTDFSKATIPADYPFGSFPTTPTQGLPIDTLGDMLTDAEGRLVVVAAYGHAGGDDPITSYAGADTWHDDTADGQVTCTLTLTNGEVHTLQAWVMCASTKYAPELVNISTIDDVMLDVAIRSKGYDTNVYDPNCFPGGWNPDYEVNFDRDIAPILNRPKDYQWVANVQSMMAFTNPPFNVRDNSDQLLAKRKAFFSYWRRPEGMPDPQINQLWDERLIPLMPLNSGTNSVTNQLIDKFLTLTQTQYFFLQQWSLGKFNTNAGVGWESIHPLDHASVGNCAGLPQSPGIEGTWNFNNPNTYSAPFRIWQAHDEAYYKQHGLDPLRDETAGGGCEPGDLSKRMAIPWQADFFQCTVQYINFTDEEVNKNSDGIPLPPTYYAYWWPPQAPWDVLTGNLTPYEQFVQGVPAGMQVNYARGINSFSQMITAWKYLGFILNQNQAADGRDYPYFVEKERNNDKFGVASVAVAAGSAVVTGDDTTFSSNWFLQDEFTPPAADGQARAFASLSPEEFETRKQRIRATLGFPRSGSRNR